MNETERNEFLGLMRAMYNSVTSNGRVTSALDMTQFVIRLSERAEKAEVELASLKEKTRWISTAEKLPENNMMVEVWCKFGYFDLRQLCKVSGKQFWLNDVGVAYDFKDVLAWRKFYYP